MHETSDPHFSRLKNLVNTELFTVKKITKIPKSSNNNQRKFYREEEASSMFCISKKFVNMC